MGLSRYDFYLPRSFPFYLGPQILTEEQGVDAPRDGEPEIPKGEQIGGLGLDCKTPNERVVEIAQPAEPSQPRRRKRPEGACIPRPAPPRRSLDDSNQVSQYESYDMDGTPPPITGADEGQGYGDSGSGNQGDETQEYGEQGVEAQESGDPGSEYQAYESQGDDTSFIETQNMRFCPDHPGNVGST